MQAFTSTVYSRLGLLGNPSDGMNGAAIAVSVENFSAKVTIEPSDCIQIIPHPQHDPSSFAGLQHMREHTAVFGYNGGLRLLMVRTLEQFCQRMRARRSFPIVRLLACAGKWAAAGFSRACTAAAGTCTAPHYEVTVVSIQATQAPIAGHLQPFLAGMPGEGAGVQRIRV
jgi:hypothetical protein